MPSAVLKMKKAECRHLLRYSRTDIKTYVHTTQIIGDCIPKESLRLSRSEAVDGWCDLHNLGRLDHQLHPASVHSSKGSWGFPPTLGLGIVFLQQNQFRPRMEPQFLTPCWIDVAPKFAKNWAAQELLVNK